MIIALLPNIMRELQDLRFTEAFSHTIGFVIGIQNAQRLFCRPLGALYIHLYFINDIVKYIKRRNRLWEHGRFMGE